MAHRDDPNVFQAYAIGAVACKECGQVHIDLVDRNEKVTASASLDFKSWIELVTDVDMEIVHILGHDA